MMWIFCQVTTADLRDVDGYYYKDSVVVTCARCQAQTTSFGLGGASIRRCLALLHDNCLRGENNQYFQGSGLDDN